MNQRRLALSWRHGLSLPSSWCAVRARAARRSRPTATITAIANVVRATRRREVEGEVAECSAVTRQPRSFTSSSEMGVQKADDDALVVVRGGVEPAGVPGARHLPRRGSRAGGRGVPAPELDLGGLTLARPRRRAQGSEPDRRARRPGSGGGARSDQTTSEPVSSGAVVSSASRMPPESSRVSRIDREPAPSDTTAASPREVAACSRSTSPPTDSPSAPTRSRDGRRPGRPGSRSLRRCHPGHPSRTDWDPPRCRPRHAGSGAGRRSRARRGVARGRLRTFPGTTMTAAPLRDGGVPRGEVQAVAGLEIHLGHGHPDVRRGW